MLYKGFKFGLLLQIAIGPVFLYIFKTATDTGILVAVSAVLGAVLMDAIFVVLAMIGIGSILNRHGVQKFLKYFGMTILLYFGLGLMLGSFGVRMIPAISSMSGKAGEANAFVTSAILTASSPLSILFWTGVFAAKISGEGFGKKELRLFGMGAVMATFVFLSIVAVMAGLFRPLMSSEIIKLLNIIIGLVIIGFGIKIGFDRKKSTGVV